MNLSSLIWHFEPDKKTGGRHWADVPGGYLVAYPDGRWSVDLDGKMVGQGECTSRPFLKNAMAAAFSVYERESGLRTRN